MLDAYIIEKQKQEKEQVREDRLELEIGPPIQESEPTDTQPTQKRGVEIIDFTI